MYNTRRSNHSAGSFEGWYIKHQARGQTLALIPALHISESGQKSASLQIITNTQAYFFEYPAEELEIFPQSFFIRLGRSTFSLAGCHLEICQPNLWLSGDLTYHNPRPLKSDIMGPFRYVPHMQCSHGVISMGHTLEGRLFLNGKTLDFSGGMGYIETDRGRSFPAGYLWTQCNCFGGVDCCVMASAADIPIGKRSFRGCISSILFGGKEYRLATYRGAKIETDTADCLVLRQGKYVFSVQQLRENPQKLRAPQNGSMRRTVHESAACTVRYEFFEGETLLFHLTSGQASFEYAQAAPVQ